MTHNHNHNQWPGHRDHPHRVPYLYDAHDQYGQYDQSNYNNYN